MILSFGRVFLIFRRIRGKLSREGRVMKEDEKKIPDWEMVDPKPPVIQSGRFENLRRNEIM